LILSLPLRTALQKTQPRYRPRPGARM